MLKFYSQDGFDNTQVTLTEEEEAEFTPENAEVYSWFRESDGGTLVQAWLTITPERKEELRRNYKDGKKVPTPNSDEIQEWRKRELGNKARRTTGWDRSYYI